MKLKLIAGALALASVAFAGAAEARDAIRIVGSSTVYPFTTTVAEQFSRANPRFRTPVVESTGTGGGMRLFCAGVGVAHPDATNASRRMTPSEFTSCRNNGVTDIIELVVGFDGLTIAHAKGARPFALTKTQVFLALAKEIPDAEGKLIPNPNKRWSDIDPSLPSTAIEVLGPPPTSGTRDSFNELVMLEGAAALARTNTGFGALRTSDRRAFDRVAQTMREDGAYIEAGENDNVIVQKLTASPTQVGIFGFSFLEENSAIVRGIPLNGVEPTFENIAAGRYTAARRLFVYFKKQHIGVVPGVAEFMAEYVSQRSMGEDGYLEKKGLVVLPANELAASRAAVQAQTIMTTLGN